MIWLEQLRTRVTGNLALLTFSFQKMNKRKRIIYHVNMKRTKTTIECNVSHLTRGLFTKLLTFSPSLCVKLRHSKILLFIRLNEKKYNTYIGLFVQNKNKRSSWLNLPCESKESSEILDRCSLKKYSDWWFTYWFSLSI